MENNQSPSDSWQRPGGSAESTPTGSVTPETPGALPSSSGFAPPPPQPAGAAYSPTPVTEPTVYDPYVPPGGPQLGMPVPNESPKRKSKLGVVAGVAAVVALGAGGVFFVASSMGSASGGADSPEGVATQLLDAIDNEDVLGMVDTLLPGEREVARQPLIDYMNELTRLEVLAPVDLGSLNGVDFTVQERNVVAQPTNVGDIANVALNGSIEVVLTGADVPVGPLIEEYVPSDELAEMRATTETEVVPFDFEITTVEQDGRWYLSMGFTAAEAARRQTGMPDIPQAGVGATGSESPEAAFNLLLDRVADFDLTGMVQTLNPGEAAALQRYAPLFINDAQQVLDQELSGVPVNFEFTTPEVRTDIDGDRATLFVDSIGITGDIEGSPFTVDFNGECLHGTFEGEEINECGGSFNGGDLAGLPFFDMYPDLEQFVNDLQTSLADVQPIGIEFVRTDGEWYISPIGTYIEGTLTVMRALDATELRTLIDDVSNMAGQFEDGVMDSLDEFDTVVGGSDEDSGYDDYSYDESSYDDYSYDDSALDVESDDMSECYVNESFDDVVACFQAAVDSGATLAEYLPAEIAFPECGRPLWNAESLSDADFIAAVSASSACFQPLVDQGELSVYELPDDVRALECFEGRNPYTVVEDDYFDRLDECYTNLG